MSFRKQEEWWKGNFGTNEERTLYQIKKNTERGASQNAGRPTYRASGYRKPRKSYKDLSSAEKVRFILGCIIAVGVIGLSLYLTVEITNEYYK